VGFAVEDRIAQTLEEVHVVLGPQIAPGRWLVAVAARSVLDRLATGRVDAALWPDVLMVPVPGTGWAVWAEADRVLVRLPDRTGFAMPMDRLPAVWALAGTPAVTLYGGQLPEAVAVSARGVRPALPDPWLAGFDLRARSRTGAMVWPKGLRSLLIVVLVASLGHLALLGADVTAMNRLAAAREADLRRVLHLSPEADLEMALAQALVARQPAAGPGMLDLLGRVFAAIADEAGRVSVQSLQYDAAEDAAVLTLEASDLSTLQAVEAALNGAGLAVSAGAATTRDGIAEVQLTLRGGGA
jgi:general secretion pathway protein L